jgi:superfamily I DNA/RNA helicase
MPEYYFNLPQFEDLNPAQRKAVNELKPIALAGGPGTGKSTVASWRHILNHEKNVNSLLLTFTKSLAHYLKSLCNSKNSKAGINVDSTIHWLGHEVKFKEIIHDEAQDLPLYTNKILIGLCESFTYGADNRQLITAPAWTVRDGVLMFNTNECSPEENLWELVSKQNKKYELNKIYRYTKQIFAFTKRTFEIPILPNESLPERDGNLPLVHVTNGNIEKQDREIVEIIRNIPQRDQINVAILAPLSRAYNQTPTHFTANYYYHLVKNNLPDLECSCYDSDEAELVIKNIHCTTFKSAKGLEFDIVIIPNFDASYRGQEAGFITWRDYYVGVTRCKSDLHLLCSRRLNLSPTEEKQLIEIRYVK